MESHPDPPRVRDSDDDNTTQTSRTDDDPVRDAFRTALQPLESEVDDDDDDDDDQEDEIVWNPRFVNFSRLRIARCILILMSRASTSPLPHPIQRPGSVSPINTSRRPSMNNGKAGAQTPQTPRGTTAQDLLKDVLGLPRTSNEFSRLTGSSAPQASLLFGSGSANAPTTSIWTDTETRSLANSKLGTHCSPRLPFLQTLPGQLHGQGHAHARSQSQGIAQMTWNSSYGASTQNSQQPLPGSPPSVAFAPSPLALNMAMNGRVDQPYYSNPYIATGLPSNNGIPQQPYGYSSHYHPPVQNVTPDSMQHPALARNLNDGYQLPYHYERDGQMNQPFNNIYVPPVQRAWGHT